MTLGLSGVCYIVAAILFALAAVPFPEPYSGRLVPVGLFFFTLGHLL